MDEGVDDELEVACRVVWSLEAGVEGQWRSMSGPYGERTEALARLEWCRVHAAPAVSYRLVRETTRVTTAVEDA